MKIERRTLLWILLGACAYWGWPGLTQATGEVAVLRTTGTSHIEHYASVWYVRANRGLWIRAENRKRHWLDDIRVNPRVELSIDGQNRAYEASPMDMANYQAFIDDIIVRDAKGTPVLDVVWNIPNEELRENLGLEKVLVRQSIFIDIDDDGRILFGPNQNVRLGNLREALSQNKKGRWSFRSLGTSSSSRRSPIPAS